MEVTDQELLREFAARRCEKSFRQLVDRHLRLVFSVAHRVTGDPQLAEEIAQTTFTTLADKAAKIETTEALAGWLYHTARHLALRAIRSEQRRRQREQMAVTMNTDEPDSGVVAEHLETAMDQLKPEDRDALVLRFFEDRNLRDVGHELGLSEDAARMRVNRSLEKLRSIFSKLGITGTTAWLATTLPTSATAVVAVPTGLGASITATVVGGTAVAATAAIVAQTTSSTMNLFYLKTAAAVIAAAVLTGTSTYLVKENEAEQFRTEQIAMASDYAKIATEQQQAMAVIQLRDDQIQGLKRDVADIPRLRGEVDRLNRSIRELQVLEKEYLNLKSEIEISQRVALEIPPVRELMNRNLEALLAASKAGDTNEIQKRLTVHLETGASPEFAESVRKASAQSFTKTFANLASFEITDIADFATNASIATVTFLDAEGNSRIRQILFRQVGDEWLPAIRVSANSMRFLDDPNVPPQNVNDLARENYLNERKSAISVSYETERGWEKVPRVLDGRDPVQHIDTILELLPKIEETGPLQRQAP